MFVNNDCEGIHLLNASSYIKEKSFDSVKKMGQLKTYGSDLTDTEWARIEPLLPPEKPVGKLRKVDLPEVVNAIFGVAQ
jgi:hypothetical protein